MADDEDEEGFGGLYENGHCARDDATSPLVFVSDLPPKSIETVTISTKAASGTVEFRDDVDLIEQIRYRRRYQRKIKPGQLNVITIQDIKDIAIYTAPVNILSPALINMLHLPTTERFMRALILCTRPSQTCDGVPSKSTASMSKSRTVAQSLYPDIVLPRENKHVFFPSSFSRESEQILPCNDIQRRRWQNRLLRLLRPQPAK